MKFRFPLQSVQNYRKTLENIAQRDLQEAMALLRDQENILQDFQSQVDRAQASRFEQQLSGGKSAPALGQIEDFLRGQAQRMDRQRAKIQECEKRVEELREILRLKAIDYKIVEELKDRQKEQFDIEQAKLEQKRVDEMNIMRFKPKVE